MQPFAVIRFHDGTYANAPAGLQLTTADACFQVIQPNAPALPASSGVYDEQVFVGLDWVVAQAGARGMRLMLTLTNYWHDYGGFQQYLRCAAVNQRAACYLQAVSDVVPIHRGRGGTSMVKRHAAGADADQLLA